MNENRGIKYFYGFCVFQPHFMSYIYKGWGNAAKGLTQRSILFMNWEPIRYIWRVQLRLHRKPSVRGGPASFVCRNQIFPLSCSHHWCWASLPSSLAYIPKSLNLSLRHKICAKSIHVVSHTRLTLITSA